MKEVVIAYYQGLKCDNPDCDYEDMSIPYKKYKSYVNEPCPKCGQPLLTKEDYLKCKKQVSENARRGFIHFSLVPAIVIIGTLHKYGIEVFTDYYFIWAPLILMYLFNALNSISAGNLILQLKWHITRLEEKINREK